MYAQHIIPREPLDDLDNLPGPEDPRMVPWRSFLADMGLFNEHGESTQPYFLHITVEPSTLTYHIHWPVPHDPEPVS